MVDVVSGAIPASIGAGSGGQINPLAMLGEFARTQNALNQNALFQQTFRARQAMGGIMQSAVNPQTGEIDWNKAAIGVATHPETGFMAGEFLNNIAQKNLLDAQTLKANLENKQLELGTFSRIAAAAAKNPQVQSASDMTPYVSDMLAAGVFPGEARKDAISWLTRMGEFKTGGEFKQHLSQMAMATQQGADQLEKLNGSWRDNLFYHPGTGATMGGWTSGVTGAMTPPAGWQTGPGPSAQVGGAASAAEAPAAPAGGLVPGQMGELQKGLFQHQAEYQKGVNDEASFAYKSDLLINEMEKALKGFKAGAGTPYYVNAAKMLQAVGVKDKVVDEVANGNLGNAQEFNKLALQVATGSLRAALLPGAGRLTNTEFNAFREANPNWDLDPRAIQKLMAFQRQLNMLAVRKSQAYSLAYGASARGEQMPAGLPDITQFEPYWIGKLQKAGFIGQDTADKLGGPAQ